MNIKFDLDQLLEECNNNKRRVARSLGMTTQTLRKKMKDGLDIIITHDDKIFIQSKRQLNMQRPVNSNYTSRKQTTAQRYLSKLNGTSDEDKIGDIEMRLFEIAIEATRVEVGVIYHFKDGSKITKNAVDDKWEI